MGYVTVVGAVALLVVVQYTSVRACYYPTQHQSNSGRNADYYVGEMSLWDAKGKGKRNVIWPWTISHSMILFRGKVFEWGIDKTYYMKRSPSSCKITWRSKKESFSRCTLRQVERWTRDYGAKNNYNLLTNNCHMFVNRLAKYLYSDCAA